MAKLNNTTVQDVTNKMSLGVGSTTNDKNYFEELYSWAPQLDTTDIFAEVVPSAANPSEADTNVTNNPTIIEKLTNYKLDELPASNGQGYSCFLNPGDTSSTRLKNFLIPQKFGFGYGFILQDSTSTTIPLTAGSYQFDYQNGIFRFNEGNTPADMGWTTPLSIVAYRYIGDTLEAGTTTSSGGIVGYTETFTNADLSGGMLTVTHNLNAQDEICHVSIKDNNNNQMEADNIQNIDQNIIQANFEMSIPIIGTWTILITCLESSVPVPPAAEKMHAINGSFLNSSTLN